MRPNKVETAVHGCHCPGDIAVCMRKVLARPWVAISFPEPTCLLVSTKTRSSGIINKLVPRARPRVFCFEILILLFFQSQISTFLAFLVRIECLCGTRLHRLSFFWTPYKPRHACAVKLEVLILGLWMRYHVRQDQFLVITLHQLLLILLLLLLLLLHSLSFRFTDYCRLPA